MAQAAFRSRKQQHVEEMEFEMRTMAGKYEGLKEKYENLSRLYMGLLKQKGGTGQEKNVLAEGKNVQEPFLLDWRQETPGVVEEHRDEEMLRRKVDVNEQLFGSEDLWV